MEIKVKYFFLTRKHFRGPGISAFAPKGVPLAQDLISELVDARELPFGLTLVKLTPHRNGLVISQDISGISDLWPDYMNNSKAWPLCSAKLRAVIDRHLIHDEDLHWISAKVSGGGEVREYYIARFNTMHDVLDEKLTTFVPETNMVIVPCFSIDKVNGLSVFPRPTEYDLWRIPSGLYVSELLKRDIQKSGITGVAFEPAKTS